MSYYALGGQCYVDGAHALQAFVNSFPVQDGGGNFLTLVSASLSGTTINYSVNQRAWTSNGLASRTGSFVLQTCTELTAPSFDPLSAGAIWTFFFSSVLMLWLISRSAGSIIEAVRKF
jgi:hypothetical protein